MTGLTDVHCHVSPLTFPSAPDLAVKSRWPCMACDGAAAGTLMIGEAPFRALDDRSWSATRRLEDMDRDEIAIQVLSPMPELLSYWLDVPHAEIICDTINAQIAELVAAWPKRFRGLGAVPLQDPDRASSALRGLRETFGLSGVEIGSNINGVMLGDPRFEPFWTAAEDLGMAVFVHALHPLGAKAAGASPLFTALAGFPLDVALAGAALINAGVIERHPRLRIALSHGGGALGALLGRLDIGWKKTSGFNGLLTTPPSDQARRLFFDSNVYEARYLRYLLDEVAPGRIFVGTDYPYDIRQEAPALFLESANLSPQEHTSVRSGAAALFLGEVEG